MTALAILFTPDYADWECAHLMATARSHMGFAVTVVTPGGAPVTSLGGVVTTPDGALESLDPADHDALVICGGAIWQTPDAPDIAPVVGAFTGAERVVAGICDGVLALARTGALDDAAHTGNSAEGLAPVEGYRGHGHYLETPKAVRAGRLVTAAGTAPVSFMAEVFRALGFDGAELDAYLDMLAAEHR